MDEQIGPASAGALEFAGTATVAVTGAELGGRAALMFIGVGYVAVQTLQRDNDAPGAAEAEVATGQAPPGGWAA